MHMHMHKYARACACACSACAVGIEVVAELAKEFGFTDVDGSRPPSIRSLAYLAPNFIFPQLPEPPPAWIRDNVPDINLPWSIFSSGPPPAPVED